MNAPALYFGCNIEIHVAVGVHCTGSTARGRKDVPTLVIIATHSCSLLVGLFLGWCHQLFSNSKGRVCCCHEPIGGLVLLLQLGRYISREACALAVNPRFSQHIDSFRLWGRISENKVTNLERTSCSTR